MIKNFDTLAQKAATSFPTDESSLSHIEEGNQIIPDGVNVETTLPEAGDICVRDTNKKLHYYTLESFDASLLPTGWTGFAFVEWRRGRKVKIDHVLGNYKWSKYFLWLLTGYTMDGEDHAFSFAAKVSNVTYTCSGNYSGTTIAEVAASMNSIVKDFDFGGHAYHVYVRNGELILQHDTYTSYLAVTATGVTATQRVGTEIPASSAMPRMNGQKTGEGSVVNMDRALIYFRADLASGTYNPATDVTTIPRSYPICLPAYLGTSANNDDHCALLRSYYGEGEAGWMNFMKNGMKVIYPSKQGVFDPYVYGEGKKNTYILAGQRAQAHDGSDDDLYPAFDAVAAYGIDCDGLRAGDWFLGTIGDIIELKSKITYPAVYREGVGSVSVAAQDADVYSRACAKLGLTQAGNDSNAWSSSRYNTSSAWRYNGYSGSANGTNYYAANQVVGSALLTLPEAD